MRDIKYSILGLPLILSGLVGSPLQLGLAENGVLGIVLVVLLGGPLFIYLLSKIFVKLAAEAQEIAVKRAEEVQANQDAKVRQAEATLEAVGDVIRRVVTKHGSTLVTQRRKTLSRDVYGNFIRDRWDLELTYFRKTVAEPAILDQLGADDLARVRRYVFLALDEELRLALVDRHEEAATRLYFDGYIQSMIDASVEVLDAAAPTSVFDEGSGRELPQV